MTSKKKKRKARKRTPHTSKKKIDSSKKKKWSWFWLVYILGFAIMLYPVASNLYYSHLQNSVSSDYYGKVDKMSDEDLQEKKSDIVKYNKNLATSFAQELDMPDFKSTSLTLFEGMDTNQLKEVLGVLVIPAIKVDMPIFNGTSDYQLKHGAGVLSGTSLPYGGESTHSVITGHRGLPTAKLFTDLPKLKKGDQFYIKTLDDKLAYEVDKITVIEPDEIEELMITKGEDYVTLLTCTPYMINTHRLLVRGHRVPFSEKVFDQAVKDSKQNQLLWLLLIILIIILLLIIWYVVRKKRKDRQLEG